jgi:hypothetical protein
MYTYSREKETGIRHKFSFKMYEGKEKGEEKITEGKKDKKGET